MKFNISPSDIWLLINIEVFVTLSYIKAVTAFAALTPSKELINLT